MCWYPNVPKYFFLFHKIMKNRRCRLNIRKTTHVVKRLFYVFFFLFSSSSFFSLFLLRLLLYRYDNFTKTINLVTLTIKKEEKKKIETHFEHENAQLSKDDELNLSSRANC